jgi:hypothetical protein
MLCAADAGTANIKVFVELSIGDENRNIIDSEL